MATFASWAEGRTQVTFEPHTEPTAQKCHYPSDKFSDYEIKNPDEEEQTIGIGALVDKIESEPQEGNVEYKFMLVDPTVGLLSQNRHATAITCYRLADLCVAGGEITTLGHSNAMEIKRRQWRGLLRHR
eukprot:60621-Rhodomonas_salina.1